MVGGRIGSVTRGGGVVELEQEGGARTYEKTILARVQSVPIIYAKHFLNISFHHQSSHIPFFNTRQSLLPLSL